jgi:hypothetical protein
MADYSKVEIQAFYDAAKRNYLACMNSKEYSIKDRSVQREDLKILRGEMNLWKEKLDNINAGKTQKKKFSRFLPMDS